jgi:hypothetical protein
MAKSFTASVVALGLIVVIAIRPHQTPGSSADCGVLRVAIAKALDDSMAFSGEPRWRLYDKTGSPWKVWDSLTAPRQEERLHRATDSLGSGPIPLLQLVSSRGQAVPRCPADFAHVHWTNQAPEGQSDSTVVEVSNVLWASDSDAAVVYVGWSNHWAGRGFLYRVVSSQSGWRIASEANAWMQ